MRDDRVMEIIGHGVDLIEVTRIEELLNRDSDFLDGWFTVREIQELGNRENRPDVVAGRVAAKEATVKAFGCGFSGDVSWQDVEILSETTGVPLVLLSGEAKRVADSLGVVSILLSISHTRSAAIASVITTG